MRPVLPYREVTINPQAGPLRLENAEIPERPRQLDPQKDENKQEII